MKPLQITDPEMLAQLRTAGKIDVTDNTGLVIGRIDFKPMSCPEFGMTDEELDWLVKDPNAEWIPADEVVAHLKSRLKQG